MVDARAFAYLAIDPTGRRVRGVLEAVDDAAAFEALRRDGLSPLSLKLRASRPDQPLRPTSIKPREATEFLGSLAELLRAGADIRTALAILAERAAEASVREICGRLAEDIGGGEALESAFGRAFAGGQPFVGPMVAAGEAAGDLAASLERAAEIIASRLKLRDQLATVLAYPAFVLLSAVGALFVILLYIVPTIAPLTAELGGEPPLSLQVMLVASDFLSGNLALLMGLFAVVVLGLVIAGRLGLLRRPWDRLVLDGPGRRTAAGLVYGAFAQSLGAMLAAGAPLGDALRLATRATSSDLARERLEPVLTEVRQGQPLSVALEGVRGFPGAVVRLVAVGEASNAVGRLLLRAGKLEEDGALRRIEAVGRVAGPALIVLLGLMLGVLMGGLLSGVSQMGLETLE